MKTRARSEILFLFFALPSLTGMLLFFVAPLGVSLYLAVVDNALTYRFVGFQNFKNVMESEVFRLALKNTGLFMAICVPANMLFPLFAAILLRKAGARKGLFGMFLLLPLVIPSGSMAFFWRSLFGLNGAVNGTFFPDAPVHWLNTGWSRVIITGVFIWKNAGFNIVLYLAGLALIPREYYECAALEGAGRFRQFLQITMVYIIPTSFLVFIMSVINSFKAFKEIYLIAGAYPHHSIYLLQHYIYNQFTSLDYQKLSAASYILMAITIGIVVFMFRFQRRLSENFS
ncbi:MAG: sugar ABC transporter permease [Clostridiales bacterium]|jgi:multiple sugar transport system permease protein|nr:sugar ABC transporter permease [Clostridiales bacterium]